MNIFKRIIELNKVEVIKSIGDGIGIDTSIRN